MNTIQQYQITSNEENFISSYRNNSYTNTSKCIKIAGAVTLLFCMQTEVNEHNCVPTSSSYDYMEVRRISQPVKVVDFNSQRLFVCTTPFASLDYLNSTSFIASFKKNCPEKDVLKLSPVFNMLCDAFKCLYIKKSFIDVVPSLSMITFNMNIGHKILLTASKSINSLSNRNVVYSISVAGDVRSNSVIDIDDLVSKIKSIQKKLG